MSPLTPGQAASALAFLCHRYVHRADQNLHEPGCFLRRVEQLRSAADPVQWVMDLSAMDLQRAHSLFSESLGLHE